MSRKGYVKKAKHFLYRLCGVLPLTAWLTLPNVRVSNFLLISIFEGGFLFLKLLEEFNKVKAENKKCIVFVKSGVFYISLGIDAYILNHILKLKLTDMPNTKRVGIPINSIEKYIGLRYEEKLNLICDKLKKGIYNFGEFRL